MVASIKGRTGEKYYIVLRTEARVSARNEYELV